MPLEQEQQTYARELPALLVDSGKFALIHRDEVIGIFGAYEDALRSGYEQFGLDPFMVKQIQAVERVQCSQGH